MDTRKILADLHTERNRIDQAIAAIEALHRKGAGGSAGTRTGVADRKQPRRRRRMSAAARKRISEMMKKRWAERKK
jgi:hypothetical protein